MRVFKILFSILFIGSTNLMACGGGGSNHTFLKDDYYNFLPKVSIGTDEENPLYNFSKGIRGYSDRVDFYKKKSQDLNLKEWENYFDKKIEYNQLQKLFYSEKKSLLARYTQSDIKDSPAFSRYIHFVAKQSKYAEVYDEAKLDYTNIIKEGKRLLDEEKNNFLKLRYLFLVMRLEHYSKHYTEMFTLYNQYYPSLKEVNSIVIEWIDALRAGALEKEGKQLEANLLYGKNLKNKTNAYLGYYDFKIKNNKEWYRLLKKLKTADEKAVFHFLRALKWGGAELKEHRMLATLAPKSVWFERLSYMIMQELQNNLYEYALSEYKENPYLKEEHKNYLAKKSYFLGTLKSLENPSFFSLYVPLYFNVVEHHRLDKDEFKRLQSAVLTQQEQHYVYVLEYLNDVSELKSLEKSAEEKLFASLEKLSKEASVSEWASLMGYTANHLSMLYPKNSTEQILTKLYSQNAEFYSWNIIKSLDTVSAKNFEKYVESTERSYYEKEFFKLTMKSLARKDVAKILAILNSKDGDYKNSQKYLKQVPKLNRKTIYNPFNVSLGGNNRKVMSKKGYTQRKFVKTMRKVQKALLKDPTSAMDHFLYATGRYNSSWFGNFPTVAWIYKKTTYIEPDEAVQIAKRMREIEKEYSLALEYAKDAEFKAKIAYQILKVKSNLVLLDRLQHEKNFYFWDYSENQLVLSAPFTKEINNYKTTYATTKFGQDIIKKCATFSYFK